MEATLKLIYNIINEIYVMKDNFNKKTNIKIKAYLIKKESFDQFKKYINYDELKDKVDKRVNKFTDVKEKIIKNIKFKTIENYVIPSIFNNSKDLINDLNNTSNKYYLINESLGSKIIEKDCDKKDINKSGLSFEIKNKNIFLYFNNNDYLKFKINGGLIEKSSLLEPKENLINIKSENKPEENESNNKKKDEEKFKALISNFENHHKIHFEILTRLFIYYKEIKQKEVKQFFELKEENAESVFLINNEWVENFKYFFEYKDLEESLDKLSENLNNDNNSDEIYNNIISKFPTEYIFKMLNKLTNNNLNEIKIFYPFIIY